MYVYEFKKINKGLLLLIVAAFFCSFGKLMQKAGSNYIEGTITDDYKNGLYSANVEIKNSKIRVFTDSKGYYKLFIPDSLCNKEITIAYSSVEAKSYAAKVCTKNLPIVINIELVYKFREENVTDIPRNVKSTKQSRQIK